MLLHLFKVTLYLPKVWGILVHFSSTRGHRIQPLLSDDAVCIRRGREELDVSSRHEIQFTWHSQTTSGTVSAQRFQVQSLTAAGSANILRGWLESDLCASIAAKRQQRFILENSQKPDTGGHSHPQTSGYTFLKNRKQTSELLLSFYKLLTAWGKILV